MTSSTARQRHLPRIGNHSRMSPNTFERIVQALQLKKGEEDDDVEAYALLVVVVRRGASLDHGRVDGKNCFLLGLSLEP